MTKKIVFTGGGSAGHVTPNLAIIESMRSKWDIAYIGSKDGIERKMVEAFDIDYHPIASGKLRRYFSLKNFTDPFKVILGVKQAYGALKKIKPDIVFSKGGFVAVPVVIAAWMLRIPIIAHESDMTPGLANRLCYPFVSKICVPFEITKKHFKHSEKAVVTGTPIRSQLYQGSKQKGLKLCGFSDQKPCLMLIGGSLGSQKLNNLIHNLLSQLTKQFQIIHICGKGNIDTQLNSQNYHQIEYANKELPDLFAAADIVISRSGANALYEILTLKKAHVLIPLSKKVSRGDQIHNARYFEKLGVSTVLDDDKITETALFNAILYVEKHKYSIIKKLEDLNIQSATDDIVKLINN